MGVGLLSCSFGRAFFPTILTDRVLISILRGVSGVSKIRLIDFDYVSLSSLNRHATATTADVGTSKVACIEKVLKQIAKWVEVDSHITIWRPEEGRCLLEGADWVVGLSYHTHTRFMADYILRCDR